MTGFKAKIRSLALSLALHCPRNFVSIKTRNSLFSLDLTMPLFIITKFSIVGKCSKVHLLYILHSFFFARKYFVAEK